MAYKSLQHFIKALDNANELIRITSYVDPVLEIAEITDRVSKQKDGGKALLFENTGTEFPILINALGSLKRINLAFSTDILDSIGNEIEELFKQLMGPKQGFFEKLQLLPKLNQVSSWMPASVSGKGKCQEVVMKNPDLDKLPILKCWPEDGGRFITFPLVHTIDPVSGIRNVGMYRMQVFEKDLTAMHWHRHKTGARHYEEYKKLGKKMPIAVALGGDPVYTYAATAPMPDNMDEYMLAGFLRKKKVELVKCLTQDIEVPSDADFVIEGYVDTEEEFIWEGPFGDHTGFYSLADWFPKFHVTCISHKKDAVYPTTIVGIPPQEDAYIGKATERIFLAPIRLTMVQELVDMALPSAGVAHNLTIVKIEKSFPGQALKVMNALWGAGQMMFNKILLVVDGDVNIHNYDELAKVVSENTRPATDIHFSMGPLDILDHSASQMAYGGKMCIDATKKLPEEIDSGINPGKKEFETFDFKEIIEKNNHINDFNISLLSEEVSLVFMAIEKEKDVNVKNLLSKTVKEYGLCHIKFIVVVDQEVNVNDMMQATWIATNNIDPTRDVFILPDEDPHYSTLVIDGTRKTHEHDNFKRDWPNIVISDDKTIARIDKNWDKFGLGKFIESPSNYFKKLVKSPGAIAGKKANDK
jgi:4-hydroxy-3-polyprenylbenzoate decarboxylase